MEILRNDFLALLGVHLTFAFHLQYARPIKNNDRLASRSFRVERACAPRRINAFKAGPRMIDMSAEASKQFWLELVNQKMTMKQSEKSSAVSRDKIVQPTGLYYSAEEAKQIVDDARSELDAQFREIDARTQRTLRRVRHFRSIIRSCEVRRRHATDPRRSKKSDGIPARTRCWMPSAGTGSGRTSSVAPTVTVMATSAATRSTRSTPSSLEPSRRRPPPRPRLPQFARRRCPRIASRERLGLLRRRPPASALR